MYCYLVLLICSFKFTNGLISVQYNNNKKKKNLDISKWFFYFFNLTWIFYIIFQNIGIFFERNVWSSINIKFWQCFKTDLQKTKQKHTSRCSKCLYTKKVFWIYCIWNTSLSGNFWSFFLVELITFTNKSFNNVVGYSLMSLRHLFLFTYVYNLRMSFYESV